MSTGEVWGILVAGGSSQRYGHTRSKLLELLAGEPVLRHSARVLHQHPDLTGLVIVTHPDWEAAYQDALAPLASSNPIFWVHGGETRRDSVRHGLQALPETCTIVLIHDAARPLVQPSALTAALAPVLSGQARATSLGMPSQNTLKQVGDDTPWVRTTLDRQHIWQVHTPQVFETELLRQAHTAILPNTSINDDAELVERLLPGENAVLMVSDAPSNLKITTAQDLALAEALWVSLTCASPTAAQGS